MAEEISGTGRSIDIGAVLKEAWELTAGFKGTCWAGYAVVLSVMLIATALINAIFGVSWASGSALVSFLGQIVLVAAVYPFLTGTIMMGVRRAAGLPVTASLVIGYMDVLVPVLIASVLVSVLCSIGFMLLLVPGIYLTVAYSLVIPLIADRKLEAWPALETSRKVVTRQWFSVAGVLLAMAIITALSAIPFGLGLIWTLPMGITTVGVLYRELFEVQEAQPA